MKGVMEVLMRRALITSSLCALLGLVLVQSSPNTSPSQNNDCRPNGAQDGTANNLSDRLEQSKGVICPQGDVDPHMTSPAPENGKMPVIRPPGTPGGDQRIQPK
jgi:hypothetical protein